MSHTYSSTARRFAAFLAITSATLLPCGEVSAETGEPGMFSKIGHAMNPANWSMPKTGLRMPEFLVPQTDQNRIIEKKNSLVTDVKSSSSSAWKTTKETFNPSRLNPMNWTMPAAGEETDEKKPGFFSSLFPPKEEPVEHVAGVNDFLNQERPR